MTRAAFIKDIKRSGLTADDAKKLGYKLLTAKQTKELTGFNASSYLITYPDINDKLTDFWRVRYLETVTGPFGALKTKPPRYSQARNTLPRFYFPKNAPAPWKQIIKNTKIGLIITEGEKKAAKACKEGLPCISVGGVWAWRSHKHKLPTIPDFDLIKWEGREVRLCFDNDLMVKPQVIGALNALAHELTKRGAVVYITHLPKASHKIGLDDYLVKHSTKSFLKLKNKPYAESAELWKLNERLAFVGAIGKAWDFKYRRFHKSRTDLLDQFANVNYQVAKADGKGFVTKNAAREWIAWPQRREYDDIIYAPGESSVVDNDINTWPGWGVEPLPGNVKPFYELLNFLFADHPDSQSWFLQWLAYPIQYPGTKLPHAVLLHSRRQGVGKSLLGEIMGDLYGKNFNSVGQDELHETFNGWLVHRQFILGEELTGSDSRTDADRIKNMVTREQVTVNIKFQPTYTLTDRTNYLLTSNRIDALYLDDDDRRAFVHEITSKAKPDGFYARISKWRHNGGASHLLHHFLHEVDVSDFNPRAPAPMTVAKQRMIDLSKSDLDTFATTLLKNPNDLLRVQDIVIEYDLFTADEIVLWATSKDSRPPTKIAVSKALSRVGIRARQVWTQEGNKKLYPLRNSDKWDRRTDEQWAAHYNKYARVTKYK